MSSGEISVREYFDGVANRLVESDLCLGGLYTTFFISRTQSRVMAAFRFAAKVKRLEPNERGTHLEFALLDDDLREFPGHPPESAQFIDNYIDFTGSKPLNIRYRKQEHYIQRGYFADIQTGLDHELIQLLERSGDISLILS